MCVDITERLLAGWMLSLEKEKEVIRVKETGIFNEVIISTERSSIFNDDHRKSKHNFSI